MIFYWLSIACLLILLIFHQFWSNLAEPIEDAGDGEAESEEMGALRAELERESLGALTRRAVSAMAGAPNGAAMQNEFDEAMDSDDPKTAVVELLMLAAASQLE